MFKSLWYKILALFGKKTESTNSEYCLNDKYAVAYESTSAINFTAIFSNKLANYVCNDSVLDIVGDNKRVDLLNEFIEKIWKKNKKVVSRIFGTGGIVIVPYVSKNKIYYDYVSQNRLSINDKKGDKIISATILSDIYTESNGLNSNTYYRWSDYNVENGNMYLTQKYTNDQGEKIDKPTYWENITDEFVVPNVDRVLFSYIMSPIDNRTTSDLYGVPITYGCDSTIAKIRKTLEDIDREYEIKKSFVGADFTMFDGDDALPTNGLYRKVDSGEDSFWEIFDPAIRDSSYYSKLKSEFELLEKEIGVSKGFLTDPTSSYQNVDEVRRALYDTMSIVGAMRENLISGLDDLLYSVDVLANYYNITPQNEYKLNINWGKALIESYQDSFNQLKDGLSGGYISKAEIRNFLMDNENMEESEKAVAEIQANNPSVKDLLGTNE